MNKIKCEIPSNIFEDFPVGTIFSHSGDFYIKINQDEIWDDLGPPQRIAISMMKLTKALCQMLFV